MKHAGIWIDHKEAFIVFAGAVKAQKMDSGMEKHVRYSGHATSANGSAEDQRDRQFTAHLGKYYDEVILRVADSDSILLLGPGEAKGELQKRLIAKGLGERVVGVETADKMTGPQVVAKVQEYYQDKAKPGKSA